MPQLGRRHAPIKPRRSVRARCCGPHNGNWPRGHRALERARNTEQPAINQTQPDIETEHWQRIRHTNLLERTFGETRRRTKVIGRLPGERSCLRLVWAVLDRASRGWRGLTYTPAATRLLQDLRRDLFAPPIPEVITEPVTTAAYHAHPEPRPPPFPPSAGRDPSSAGRPDCAWKPVWGYPPDWTRTTPDIGGWFCCVVSTDADCLD
jgi:Transposase, Mutator family